MIRFIVGLVLVCGLAFSYEMDFNKDTTCLVRHLKVHKNSQWVAKIELKNGEKIFGVYVIAKNIAPELEANKLVKHTKELYKTIVDNSHDAIYIYQDNKLLFINNRLCELIGYSEEEVMSIDIWGILLPDDLSRIKELAKKREQGKDAPNSFEAGVVCKNGDVRYCSFSVGSISYGGKTAVLGQVRDITHEKNAELKVKSELERLYMIFNSIDAYVYVSDMDSFEILFANDKIKNDIGRDCIGKKCYKMIYDNKGGQCDFCNNKYLVGKDGKMTLPIEWEYFNKKANKWFMITNQAIKWPDGRVVRLEVARDITNQKKLYKTVTESNQKFKSIFDNAPLGIMYYNQRGVIQDCNDVFISQLGSTKQVLIGLDMPNELKDKELIRQLNNSLNTKKGIGYYEGMYKSVTGRGGSLPVRILFRGIRNDKNEIQAGICITEDISERIESTKELKVSQQTFKNIYDNAIDAIYIQDLEGRFVDVNQGVINMYGYTKEEIIGKTPDFLADKEKTDFVAFEKTFEKVLNGEPQQVEFWGKRKNGESFPKIIRLTKSTYYGEDSIIVFAIDITERHNIETKLKEREEQYRIITESADDLIAVTTLSDDPVCTYINESHLKYLGYDYDDMVGKKAMDFIHPDSIGELKAILFDSLNEYGKSGKGQGKVGVQIRFKIKSKKNEWRLIESNATLYGNKIIFISRDITERNKQEVERTSQLWLLETLDIVDAELNNLFDNRFVLQNILGVVRERCNTTKAFLIETDEKENICLNRYSSYKNDENTEDAVSRQIPDYIKTILKKNRPSEIYLHNKKQIRKSQVLKNPGVESLLVVSIRPKLGSKWVMILGDETGGRIWNKYEKQLLSELGSRLNNMFNSIRYHESIETSKKELEDKSRELESANNELNIAIIKAKESDKLKSLFLANMSHEIRTPMNSIIGFSDLMRKSFTTDMERIEYSSIIHKNSKMLLALISDIIDISKIEAGELSMVKRACNLNSIIYDLYDQFKIKAVDYKDGELEFKHQVALGDNNCTIKTDRVRLTQIISNLLQNAFKFTDKGSIEFGYLVEDEKTLKLFVKDTGIGIKKGEQKIIFKRFGQSLTTNKALFGGAGLGLSISEGLVGLLGGEMWVESTYGKGAAFYFTLPLSQPLKNNKQILFKRKDMKIPNWENKNILVVDDNYPIIQFFEAVLKPTKAKLTYADNGSDAIKMVKESRNFDVVLMDIRMPGISGLEAAAIIKEINSEIIVIAQTAYALSGDRERALDNGCDDYLSKPIMVDNLLDTLKKYLN
jgi:PAS domain S-box-containing protein